MLPFLVIADSAAPSAPPTLYPSKIPFSINMTTSIPTLHPSYRINCGFPCRKNATITMFPTNYTQTIASGNNRRDYTVFIVVCVSFIFIFIMIGTYFLYKGLAKSFRSIREEESIFLRKYEDTRCQRILPYK